MARRPKMTQSQRLAKRGIVHVEAGDVLARLTQAQSKDIDKAWRPIRAVALAVPLAQAMRTRVRDRRLTADGPIPRYGSRPVLLSQTYASAAKLGRRYWRSSIDMHDALPQHRGYYVTGKMWGGLQVRGSGRAAIVDFAGSSPGRGKHGKPANVRNQVKANAILRAHGVNVVEPNGRERADSAIALRSRLAATYYDLATGLQAGRERRAGTKLAREIERRLKAGGDGRL